ncbi:MAG: serine kinase [candidate division WOR-3 bacterium]|nr:MAG: serine kinase [candidate division WOR-3 bacterium]
MKIREIVKACDLQLLTGEKMQDREITGGYVSDLLSDVMAHCKKGAVWITLQAHPNIVAVAVLKEISGIVIVNGRKPEKDTITKAETESVSIMSTERSAFDVTGQLYGMGLRGTR